MNMFIIPGGRSHLMDIQEYLTKDVCGVLIHEKIDVGKGGLPEIEKRIKGNVYTLDSLLELSDKRFQGQDLEFYEDALKKLLSDQRSHYLASRSSINSAFNNAITIENILVNSIAIIRTENPDCLISSSTPHSLEAWIFAKCFEYLDLPVYILERTPIISRAWIYRGLDTQEVVSLNETTGDSLTETTRELVDAQRYSQPGARGEDGMPISRINLTAIKGADGNQWWSLKREFQALFSSGISRMPARLVQSYMKYRLYRSYFENSEENIPDSPFIVYFMHYQPERSSLPEGLNYAQQWFVIRLLSWVLPDGWTLLVREHPTTWCVPIDWRVRTIDLYQRISSLKNAQLCTMDIDTFELIDKCRAVATLTGKTGFQAILRGKPVIAFGLPAYKDHPACFSVKSTQDLEKAVETIDRGLGGECFEEATLAEYLLWVERNSISESPDKSDWRNTRLMNFAMIYKKILHEDLIGMMNSHRSFRASAGL